MQNDSRCLRAQELLLSEDIHLSVQVLQEFPVAALRFETCVRALELSAPFGLSLWDATIETALQRGVNRFCTPLYQLWPIRQRRKTPLRLSNWLRSRPKGPTETQNRLARKNHAKAQATSSLR